MSKISRRRFFCGSSVLGTGLLFSGVHKSETVIPDSGPGEEQSTSLMPIENVYSTSHPAQLIFKKVEITPSVVEVGNNEEFAIKITIGPGYAQQPTRLAISLPTQLGFSKPALFIDEDYSYLEVYSNNPEIRWEKKIWDVQQDFFVDQRTDHPRKWGQHLAIIDISTGLKEDDYIQLNWGDLGRGFGKGTPTTVLCPKEEYFQYIWVRYFADQSKGVPDMERDIPQFHQRPVADAETKVPLRILPKPLHRWRLIRKTHEALLVPMDLYGNVTPVRNFGQEIDVKDAYRFIRNGVYHYGNSNIHIQTRRRPLTKTAGTSNVFEGMNVYFGDMHNHSKYSNDVIEESRTEMGPGDMQIFARERAGLDFYATSEHHQPQDSPRDHTLESTWNETIEAVMKNDKPGEFLVFSGFEFRCQRGDTVLFFNYLPEYKEINRPEWTDIRKVWDGLRGKDYISHPHFHNPGRLAENEWWVCPYEGVEPVVEIFSCHRSFERFDAFEQGRSLVKHHRKDRMGVWFLQNQMEYGFVANSDSHYGHPGTQGLAAVYAKALDKKSIIEAYRSRHVYGVSGDRIRLLFTGNGKLMGSEVTNTSAKEFFIDVVAENKLKKVELFKNGELFRRFVPDDSLTFKKELEVADPEPSNWYLRVTQENNQMAWSSAIWYG
jgi:hypothetical protein